MVNKNIKSQRDIGRPSNNAILPPDLLNDIYEDVRLNGGSGRNLFREPYNATNDWIYFINML